MRKVIYLYHWTADDNLASVSGSGLQPVMATGASKSVWACCRGKIRWAREHVAARHDLDPRDMSLLRFRATDLMWLMTAWTGVYRCPRVIPATLLDLRVLTAPREKWERLADWHERVIRPPATADS